MEGFAEDVGLPDFLGALLKFLEQVDHQFLRLLLTADDWGNLRHDVRPHHVDRGGAGPQFDPKTAPLLDDLRLFQDVYKRQSLRR